ncbi:MAG: 2-phosphosulfolactate phosphatase [Thermoguttaceae bacterium]
MSQILNVYALPKLADPKELAGGTVVVIDVLRATTVTVFALEAGAREVIPCVEVDEARQCARRLPAGQWVLGGERRGLPIRGFALGNSPAEYTPDRVAGKTVVLSTTNGVRAMLYAREAENVLIAAFVNATAVVGQLLGQEQVHVLCAGTDGEYSGDDILLAGMLVERLGRLGGRTYVLNAQATAAREFWLHSFALPQALGAEPLSAEVLVEQLAKSPGGRNLVAVGMEDDLLIAAAIDRFQGVPRLDRDGHIRLT